MRNERTERSLRMRKVTTIYVRFSVLRKREASVSRSHSTYRTFIDEAYIECSLSIMVTSLIQGLCMRITLRYCGLSMSLSVLKLSRTRLMA